MRFSLRYFENYFFNFIGDYFNLSQIIKNNQKIDNQLYKYLRLLYSIRNYEGIEGKYKRKIKKKGEKKIVFLYLNGLQKMEFKVIFFGLFN